MILVITGNIGSGKSLSIARMIKNRKQFVFTNFRLKGIKNYQRLKFNDIIIQAEKIKDWRVNWDFWDKARNKHKSFSIYLDEVHNVISSRESSSKKNILMSRWLAQIRKLTNDSQTNNLILISQTYRKLDVDFRDLTQIYIRCECLELKDKVYIKNKYYSNEERYILDNPQYTEMFLGNPFFDYFFSKDFITFSDSTVKKY